MAFIRTLFTNLGHAMAQSVAAAHHAQHRAPNPPRRPRTPQAASCTPCAARALVEQARAQVPPRARGPR